MLKKWYVGVARYEWLNYYVDVEYLENEKVQIWISRKNQAIKLFLIGYLKGNDNIDDDWIKGNLIEYIEVYEDFIDDNNLE